MSDTITITPEEMEMWASTATARINAVTPERQCEITAQERLVKSLKALEQVEARAEKAEAENERQIMISKALARKLAQATRTWGKAGNMDNSAGYWMAWAEHDADAEIKAARRSVADSEVKG